MILVKLLTCVGQTWFLQQRCQQKSLQIPVFKIRHTAHLIYIRTLGQISFTFMPLNMNKVRKQTVLFRSFPSFAATFLFLKFQNLLNSFFFWHRVKRHIFNNLWLYTAENLRWLLNYLLHKGGAHHTYLHRTQMIWTSPLSSFYSD